MSKWFFPHCQKINSFHLFASLTSLELNRIERYFLQTHYIVKRRGMNLKTAPLDNVQPSCSNSLPPNVSA